jgi:hypothetical protein
MSFKFFRQLLCITAILLYGISLWAQAGHWKMTEITDPLDSSIKIDTRISVRAEGTSGEFRATATCARGLFFTIDYFGSSQNGKPLTYLIDDNDYLVGKRMSVDGHLRVIHTGKVTFRKEVTIGISSAEAYANRNTDPPGVTPQDIVNAKTVKIELPLNNGEKPILTFHPTDPDFQKFASKCGSELDQQPSALQTSVADAFSKLTPSLTTMANQSPSDTFNQALKEYGHHQDPTAIQSPKPNIGPVYTKPIQPQPNAVIVSPTANPRATLISNLPPGSAALTVNSAFQSPNPMAGAVYYLMRDDFSTTMTKNGYPLPAGADPKTVFSQVCGRPDQVETCHRMILASKANPAAIKQSDISGTAVLGPVPPGAYYLFIYSSGPGGISLYWNEKVTLTAGSNSFIVGMENSKPLR